MITSLICGLIPFFFGCNDWKAEQLFDVHPISEKIDINSLREGEFLFNDSEIDFLCIIPSGVYLSEYTKIAPKTLNTYSFISILYVKNNQEKIYIIDEGKLNHAEKAYVPCVTSFDKMYVERTSNGRWVIKMEDFIDNG